jgi:phage terminase small subunit
VSAGYSPNRGNAATLKANQSILDRVEELLSGAAARAEVTVESLIAEAEECRAAALEAGQFAAVIAAVREKGILSGKRMERQEIRYKNESIYNLSDDELIHIIATGSGERQTALPTKRYGVILADPECSRETGMDRAAESFPSPPKAGRR